MATDRGLFISNMDNFIQIVYPVNRILAEPSILYMVESYMDGPPFEMLRQGFYGLLESCMIQLGVYEFGDECDVVFKSDYETGEVGIILPDVSMMFLLTPNYPGEQDDEKVWINSVIDDAQAVAATDISLSLMAALNSYLPEELKYNILIKDLPHPENNFLIDNETQCFNGEFRKLDEPEVVYSFKAKINDSGDFTIQSYEKATD